MHRADGLRLRKNPESIHECASQCNSAKPQERTPRTNAVAINLVADSTPKFFQVVLSFSAESFGTRQRLVVMVVPCNVHHIRSIFRTHFTQHFGELCIGLRGVGVSGDRTLYPV